LKNLFAGGFYATTVAKLYVDLNWTLKSIERSYKFWRGSHKPRRVFVFDQGRHQRRRFSKNCWFTGV